MSRLFFCWNFFLELTNIFFFVQMAYLYNMFESQVDDVCKGSNQAECKKDLLKYGLKNLHDMPEDHLDTMDPYQRNANSLSKFTIFTRTILELYQNYTRPILELYQNYTINIESFDVTRESSMLSQCALVTFT